VFHPGVHVACGQAEGHSTAEREDGVLAGEVVRRGLRHLDGVVLDGVNHTEGGNDVARSVHRDFELAARESLDGLGEFFGGAEDGGQRLGEAAGQAPAHGSLCVHGGGDTGGQDAGDASVLDH